MKKLHGLSALIYYKHMSSREDAPWSFLRCPNPRTGVSIQTQSSVPSFWFVFLLFSSSAYSMLVQEAKVGKGIPDCYIPSAHAPVARLERGMGVSELSPRDEAERLVTYTSR